MLPQRWPSVTTMPSGRRILPLEALLFVTTVVVVAAVVVVTTKRPFGLALMVVTDQHQSDTRMKEWKQQAGLKSKRWWWWRGQQQQRRRCLSSGGDYVGSSRRRKLIGSALPTCRFKCGRCTPCRAIRVSIQLGRSSPLEYYPEAWRCQCGSKLFMP